MLRTIACTLLIYLSQLSVYSQGSEKPNVTIGTNYYGYTIDEQEICDWVAFTSKPEVSKAVENIVKRSGLRQNFYVMECPNTDNCFAATRNGERLIVYDSKFISRLSDLTKTDWGAMSILAHEIGHHLQGHTIKKGGSEHDKELEADEFSGFVMYQLGATLKQAQAAIFSLTQEYTTSTHPPKSKRLKAIETGYQNAKELYPELKNKPIETNIENPQPEVIIVRSPAENTKKSSGCIQGNCRDGYGIAINSRSDEKYEGEWSLGKRHGKGKEYQKDGKLKYEGAFINNKYEGFGVLYLKSGEKYSGEFIQGIPHGKQSTFTQKNGDRIIVDYINGKKEGKARYIYYGGVEGTKFYKNDRELK
ncbi:MAG: MORN repeat-containing protein [Leadbetterella sp.]